MRRILSIVPRRNNLLASGLSRILEDSLVSERHVVSSCSPASSDYVCGILRSCCELQNGLAR